MPGRMEGRRALVTGGASGIGAATAELFAAEGAAVVLADLDRQAGLAGEVVARIEGKGGTAWFQPVEVRDEAAVQGMVDAAVDRLGGVDAVVASAGVAGHAEAQFGTGLLGTELAHWQFVLDVNLTGVMLTAQRAARWMVAHETPGTIVTLASSAAKLSGLGAYSVSKAGLWMYTRGLAAELAPHRIRVNAIGPGLIWTPLVEEAIRRVMADPAIAAELTERGGAAGLFGGNPLASIPLGRVGQPSDVAYTALFLSCDEGSYYTGALLHPDGGIVSTLAGG